MLTSQSFRIFKDRSFRAVVTMGGNFVIVAILLIFLYLLYVVAPMFESGEVESVATYNIPGSGKTLALALEEQNEVAVRFTDSAEAIFFRANSGEIINRFPLALPPETTISSFYMAGTNSSVAAYATDKGQILLASHQYRITYPNDKRLITPFIDYPLGKDLLQIDPNKQAIVQFVFQLGEEGHSFIARTADERLLLTRFSNEGSALDEDETELVANTLELPSPGISVDFMLMDEEQRVLYLASRAGDMVQYDISDQEDIVLQQRSHIVKADRQLEKLTWLTGTISLLVVDSQGDTSQWFPVSDKGNFPIPTFIRDFESKSQVVAIAAENARKGFAVVTDKGNLEIFHTTANQQVLEQPTNMKSVERLVFSPRSNALLVESADEKLHFWAVINEYPEVSWSSLWGKVWYESYQKPEYIWQSSSSSNDFEPKMSLVPISFGTIKAAFYAMMIAVPLAILGAMFTAYFMAPRMRRIVKPSIETMEALPTVILGFLAGLWLAPLIETNLPGIFSLLFVMPIAVLIAAWSWTRLPSRVRHKVPDGWEAFLLLPLVIIVLYTSLGLSPFLEHEFFGGDMRSWLTNEAGISFDQRNSIVVGLAMGFAVIPTIFSIAEDAIYSVPKSLTHSSLALGATPWQTMWRVVLLTASPGIFSAIMIGFGRAVGETMIVLMATGNTPIMDFNIFEGMRTLSANIAVEVPESEVGSTHYRVLFLAALVLFSFTFFFNTIAELVRQRLRRKYSNL